MADHVTEVLPETGQLALQLAGGREVFVYQKPDHVPATFTILNFPVDDIDTASTSWLGEACGSSGTRASS